MWHGPHMQEHPQLSSPTATLHTEALFLCLTRWLDSRVQSQHSRDKLTKQCSSRKMLLISPRFYVCFSEWSRWFLKYSCWTTQFIFSFPAWCTSRCTEKSICFFLCMRYRFCWTISSVVSFSAWSSSYWTDQFVSWSAFEAAPTGHNSSFVSNSSWCHWTSQFSTLLVICSLVRESAEWADPQLTWWHAVYSTEIWPCCCWTERRHAVFSWPHKGKNTQHSICPVHQLSHKCRAVRYRQTERQSNRQRQTTLRTQWHITRMLCTKS